MTSELKSATSRANGAKSHGPTTVEGKEKSSQNSLNHGFTAKKTVLLACENPNQFQEMLGDYAATYHPGSPVEEGLVNEMGAWLLYDNAQLIAGQLFAGNEGACGWG